MGVASPSDLIRDTRTTPFNIGRRIELTDFTETEAAPLAAGLEGVAANGRNAESANALLQRILYWTGGHPYLTQRLCQAVAQEPAAADAAAVDRLCEALYLSPRAQERDDNLLFVRERLLQGSLPRFGREADSGGVEADLASLLDLYGRVRRGRPVPDDEMDPLVTLLGLSGIARVAAGALQTRNRIYARVFDLEWVRSHMPDAELRRQRAAYRAGLRRTASVAAVVVAAIGGLALLAIQSGREARIERDRATRMLYAAQVNLAQRSWEDGSVPTALGLLDAQRPEPGREELRGFEWRYLWGLCQGDADVTLRGHKGAVYCVALSPDGRTVASASADGTVKLWDLARREVWKTLQGHTGGVGYVQFAPGGKDLASGSDDGTVTLWDLATGRARATFQGHTEGVSRVAFSPDGRLLASGSGDNTVKLWAVRSPRATESPTRDSEPRGRETAPRAAGGATAAALATLRGHAAPVMRVAFSLDGRTLASGSIDGTVKLWNVASHQAVATLQAHNGPVEGLAFSPDGNSLASGSWDSTVRIWHAPPFAITDAPARRGSPAPSR